MNYIGIRYLGIAAAGLGIVLFLGPSYGLQFNIVTPTCLPGPYPNPAIPPGTTMVTNGGAIGYYQGSTFVAYTGYLSGLQVNNGIATACTLPTTGSTTVTTSGTISSSTVATSVTTSVTTSSTIPIYGTSSTTTAITTNPNPQCLISCGLFNSQLIGLGSLFLGGLVVAMSYRKPQ